MWVLLLIMFNGDMNITYYPTEGSCESALTQKTDLGNYKHMKVAKCINRDMGAK